VRKAVLALTQEESIKLLRKNSSGKYFAGTTEGG
jgi:hypothetical protein